MKDQPDKEGEFETAYQIEGIVNGNPEWIIVSKYTYDNVPIKGNKRIIKVPVNSGGEQKSWRLTKEQMLDIFRAGAGFALNQFVEPDAKQYFKDKFGIDL